MLAIGLTSIGDPHVLKPFELPDPTPEAGEVLIRVRAAAVNPTDTMRRTMSRFVQPADADADPRTTRTNHDGERVFVPGMDAAGVVESIGPDTHTDLSVGDPVMAIVVPNGSHGAYSELIALPADSVTRVPEGADFAHAASLPMNALTARLALDTLDLAPGSTVAVTGAAGALGGYAVELAKEDGLIVVADASDADEQLIRDFGADVVLRRGEHFAQEVREHFPEGADAVIDGSVQLEEIAPAVKDGGKIITIRGHRDTVERGVTFAPIMVVDYAREHQKLDDLRRLAEDGKLTLRVADTLPKEQAAEAHRRLEAGGVRGRLILEF